MTVLKHELKQGKISLVLWTASIAFMLGICIMIFPEMKAQMDQISFIFSKMGAFSSAFGMDKLNFGEFIGFFSIECGNILGLCGAFFAALLGISVLAKEEKDHTAEFLLTHPLSRMQITLEKLLSIILQIVILNVFCIAVTIFCAVLIREPIPVTSLSLMFLSYFLMQLEIACITFGISAFLKKSNLGIGLGLAAVFYFLNIMSNLTKSTKFLKYFTPFSYTDGAEIVSSHTLPMNYLIIGMLFSAAGIIAGFRKYLRKDIS